MNLKKYTTKKNLDKYAFFWSEARLVLAALALFFGGKPIILFFGSGMFVSSILNLSWVISGIAALYLLYRWNANHKKIFGKKDAKTNFAFFVSVVSGINLGIAGILANNIGMLISSNRLIFFVVGILYLWSARQLFVEFKQNEKRIFN